jgi:hypothetical protein
VAQPLVPRGEEGRLDPGGGRRHLRAVQNPRRALGPHFQEGAWPVGGAVRAGGGGPVRPRVEPAHAALAGHAWASTGWRFLASSPSFTAASGAGARACPPPQPHTPTLPDRFVTSVLPAVRGARSGVIVAACGGGALWWPFAAMQHRQPDQEPVLFHPAAARAPAGAPK